MKIYLVGFMGSGKTTAAKKAASRLKLTHIDIDSLIENKYCESIKNIFKNEGEDWFRVIEREVLISTFSMDDVVVSTGGGTPCFFDNMDLINSNGTSFYIKIKYKALLNRLINSKKERPLIINMKNEDLELYVKQLLEKRETYYNKAHYTIEGESINIDHIIDKINLE